METLTIPHPLKDLAPVQYDLRLVAAAEARVKDVAIVNTTNGQELMALFCRAAFSLSKVYSDLQNQLVLVKDRVAHRKAVMLVDEIPAKLKTKGLQDNQMTRQAFLDLDDEFRKASLVQGEIEAAIVYIEKQLKATEGTLSGIKKIYDATNSTYKRPNPTLPVEPGSTPSLTETEASPPRIITHNTSTAPRTKYGKPDYGT